MKPLHIIKKEGNTEFHLLVGDSPAMIKPSYEELERENGKLRQLNVGVRGLLQRAFDEIVTARYQQGKSGYDDATWVSGHPKRVALVAKTIAEFELAPSGAESADIGKLDTASSTNCTTCGKQILTASTAVASGMMPKLHEYFCACTKVAGVEMGKVNSAPHSSMAEPFPYKGQVAGSSPVAATILNELVSAIVTYLVEMSADNLDVLDKAVDKSQAWLMAGSAETGGEKAAQSFREALSAALYRVYPKHTISVGHVAVEMREWLANFRRSSQNQTATSGVEGAHEGTTADKKGSREPEKLNNAQKCPDCAGAGYDCVRRPMGGYGHQNVQCWTCKGTGKLALAESSLSKTIDATGENPSF